MKYGALNLIAGNVRITRTQRTILRHYIGTNRSDQEHLGREATYIDCDLLTRTPAELRELEQVLHDGTERDLEYRDRLYKRVVPDREFTSEPVTYRNAKWRTSVRFIALDPVAYDIESGEVIY